MIKSLIESNNFKSLSSDAELTKDDFIIKPYLRIVINSVKIMTALYY